MSSLAEKQRRTPSRGRPARPWRWPLLVLGGAAIGFLLLVALAWGPEWCKDRGALLLDARRHDDALTWLNRAAWFDESDAELQFLLARVHRRLGDLPATRRHLQRAHDLGWNIAQLEREQLIALAQDGQYDQLAGHWGWLLQGAGSDAPEIAEAFVTERASKFMLQEAQVVLNAWQTDYPQDPQPRFWQGKILEVLGDWTGAAEEYRAALQIDPSRDEVRLRLAQALMRQMKFEDAVKQLQPLQDATASVDVHVALAQCWNKLGQSEQARALLEKSLEQSPRHLVALRELADLELAGGDPQRAYELATRALELEPVDRELHYVLAQALQRLGRSEEAQREFALVHEATKPVLRLAKTSPALAKDPSNVALRFEIAETTWKYKSRTEGARWLHSVLEFDPHHAPTHQLLAEHYTLQGDASRAAWHREQVEKRE